MLQFILFYLAKPIKRKNLFGKEYVQFDEFIIKCIQVYQTCAILGYTYQDKLNILLELMTDENANINETISALEKMATMRYEMIDSSTKNFADLIMDTEMPQLMQSFYKAKIVKYENATDFHKVGKTKIPYTYAVYYLQPLAYQAIGFGYKYAEETKDFLAYSPNEEMWNLAYKSGLNIPKEIDKVEPLETQQEDIKRLIKPYVERERPDLLQKLDLD